MFRLLAASLAALAMSCASLAQVMNRTLENSPSIVQNLTVPGAVTLDVQPSNPSYFGGVNDITPVTHNFLTGLSGGTFSLARPACGDLSNAAASCSVDTTVASNITSGVLSYLRLPQVSPTNAIWIGADNNTSGASAADQSVVINGALQLLSGSSSSLVNVYLPAGSYHLKYPINIAPGQCLIGDGTSTVLDVDMDFSPSATGIVVVTPTSANLDISTCVKNIRIYEHLPPDITATASAATTGDNHIVVSGATGTIVGGMYVYDATHPAAIPVANNHPATTVSSVVGSTVNISPNLVGDVTAGDTIWFARPRTDFANLGTCSTTTVGGRPCKYPWVIYNNGLKNFHIDNILYPNAWDGVYQRGSSFHFGYVEGMAFDVGLDIDNVANSSAINQYMFWNFDIAAANTPTPTILMDVFYDGSTVAANLGRLDGTYIGAFQSWTGAINFTSNFTWASFGSLELDGNFSNMNVAACRWLQIANFYTTKNEDQVGAGILMNPSLANDCHITISQAFVSTSSPLSLIDMRAGELYINGGYLNFPQAVPSFVTQSGGILGIHDTNIHAGVLSSGVVFVSQSAGSIQWQNNMILSSPVAGNTIALSLTDDPLNKVSGNLFNGWAFTPPGPLGQYEPMYQARFTGAGTYTWAPKAEYSKLRVKGCGWGGPGGSGAVTSTTAAASGGGGGGSGLCIDQTFPMPAGTVTVVIGSAPVAGTAVTAGTPTVGVAGTAGGLSTVNWTGITQILNLYAGGAGAGGQLANTSGGGGSAGLTSAGGDGTTSGGTAGGNGGAAGGTGVTGSTVVSFGCGGSGSSNVGVAGNTGFFAVLNVPGCGGAGGGLTASNGGHNGGNGGKGLGTGSVPAGGTVGTPNGGIAHSATNNTPGSGAAGGYGAESTATAGNGGAGSIGDGGGGGGACAYSTTCTSGAGGIGGSAFVDLIPVR
jgi:hypothetical protein